MSAKAPELYLFDSPSGAERLARAAAFLREVPSGVRTLIVAPSTASISHLLARAVDPGDARLGVHRHTLSSLATSLASHGLAREERVAATGLSLLAVCMRVVDELAREGRLGRFGSVATQPGFARALAASIEALRSAGVPAESVSIEDPDLAVLYARYLATLDTLRLADRVHTYEVAAAEVDASPPSRRWTRTIWLDVRLTDHAEAQLFSALARHGDRHLLTLLRGDERTEFAARAAFGTTHVERHAPAPETDLTLLQTRLFQGELAGTPPEVRRGHVHLLSSTGEGREAVELVRKVQAEAGRGTPFDRMAILLCAPAEYRMALAEALDRGDVPAYFADTARRPYPQGRALLALLACAEEGLSARAFADFMSLGVARSHSAADDDGSPFAQVAPRHFERLLVDASVMGGRDRWRRRLAGLREGLTQELAGLDPDCPSRGRIDRDLEGLRNLEAFALPILDALTALPHGANWGVWIHALTALAELAIRDPEPLREALTELSPLTGVGPVSLSDARRLLSGRLSEVSVRETGPTSGRLFVGAIEDALGRTFDHVFVPGLAEKLFPPRMFEDPLLPDAVRERLSPQLETTEERVREERLRLRMAVGTAVHGITLSFPRFDTEHGRPRVPSFYGLEVLAAVETKLPAFEDLLRRADPGAAPRMGFPAPDDPQRAIDAAEFDLAMLHTLLSGPESAQRGAASYLLSANATLARALRFRARRWSLRRFTAADGLVVAGDAERLLGPHRLRARAYSATALSQFADCPYKFFLHAVVGLSPRPEAAAADAIDPRQRGTLFHAVQAATLSALRRAGHVPLHPDQLQAALPLMRSALDAEAARVKDACAPAIDTVFREAVRELEHDLTQWLTHMAREPHFGPMHVELGFGLPFHPARDPSSRPEAVELPMGLCLRGAIDLVECAAGTERDPRPVLRATDHKTSEAPSGRVGVLNGGRTLQPVLYALALEALFPEAQVRSGRLFFCTNRGGFTEHEVMLHGAARAAVTDLIQIIDRSVGQGFLPAAPRPGACETCDYRSVCGPYEEERVAQHKDPRPLAPLAHVRALP